MSRGKATHQMSIQMELALNDGGEAPGTPRSGEAGRAVHGKERSGNHCLLMEQVVARENAIAAFKRVRRNKGSPGIDGMTVEELEPYLRDQFGNPSSDHAYGYRTHTALQMAREQLAALLDAAPEEVVFTGGGSEANNLAIKGVAYALRARGNHLITSAVEHPAVAEPLRFLERQGYQVTTLPVDTHGRVDPEQVAAAITERTILVSIMHANNEVGTLQPIGEIARIARERGVLMHTDAAQSVVLEQVSGGLAVRMAVLYHLLAGEEA